MVELQVLGIKPHPHKLVGDSHKGVNFRLRVVGESSFEFPGFNMVVKEDGKKRKEGKTRFR